MSHGDYMEKVPEGFALAARSDACPNVAIADESRGFYGVQYHPEVNHTEHGIDMIRNFLYEVCHAAGDWTMEDYKRTAVAALREKIGDGRVLLALSGGVDSSVAAALLAEAVGEQLTCVFVDHGLMRKNEGDEVEAAFSKWAMNFVRVDAESRFLAKLAGVDEPEHKRKIIGEEFIRVFEEEAKKVGAVDYLAQGTIYRTSSSPGRGTPPSSRATTTWAACRITWILRRSWSRCACCSRTRCGSWAGSWACRSTWWRASPSRGRGWPSG